MPPGIYHENTVCWDDLDVWSQAKFIAYDQVRSYDESGGDEARKKSKKESRCLSERISN